MLFAGVYVSSFQSGKFTGWGSRGVKLKGCLRGLTFRFAGGSGLTNIPHNPGVQRPDTPITCPAFLNASVAAKRFVWLYTEWLRSRRT